MRSSLLEQLTDLFVVGVIAFSCLPETLVGAPVVGVVPLRFAFLYAAMTTHVLSELALGRLRHATPFWKTVLVASAYMAIVGAYRDNEMRFFAIDASTMGALLLGMRWRPAQDNEQLVPRFGALMSVVALIFFGTLVGLSTGTLVPAEAATDVRTFTYSMFVCSTLISVGTPLWMATSKNSGRILAFTSAAAMPLVAAVASATRSQAAVWAISMPVLLSLQLGRALRMRYLLLGALVLGAGVVSLGQAFDGTNLLGRMMGTSIAEEVRYGEIEGMFDYLSVPGLLFGSGFGARLPSPIQYSDGTYLAHAPHIGVLTIALKGGLLCFLLVIVVPWIIALKEMLRGRHGATRWAAAAGTLLYLLGASLSGGWDAATLLILGVQLGELTKPQESGLAWAKAA